MHAWSGQAVNYFFLVLLVGSTAYALAWGGAPERIAASVYALSCVVTFVALAASPARWQSVEVGVFILDVLTFAIFCVLAMRAHRFWPIWVSGLPGLGVFGHLARWAGPDLFWWAYAVIMSIWSYPILAIIALGTWHHQRRLARFDVDPSWSSEVRCSLKRRRAFPTTSPQSADR